MIGDARHLLTITQAMKRIVTSTAAGPILMETMTLIQVVTLHLQVVSLLKYLIWNISCCGIDLGRYIDPYFLHIEF